MIVRDWRAWLLLTRPPFSTIPFLQDTAFYNGFQISHSSLWTSAEFRQYFEHLDREGGMFYYRWNDANIHTLALSLFTPAEEIAVLTDVGYKHWPFIQQRTNRHVIKKPLAMAVDGLAYKVSQSHHSTPCGKAWCNPSRYS
jgi:hypothetical protein